MVSKRQILNCEAPQWKKEFNRARCTGTTPCRSSLNKTPRRAAESKQKALRPTPITPLPLKSTVKKTRSYWSRATKTNRNGQRRTRRNIQAHGPSARQSKTRTLPNPTSCQCLHVQMHRRQPSMTSRTVPSPSRSSHCRKIESERAPNPHRQWTFHSRMNFKTN